MPKVKQPHHRGDYQRRAYVLTALAYADPDTRCWRCGRTLAEHAPHHTGRPARWTAGHVNPGEVGGELRPEASTCNYAHGAELGNQRSPWRRRRSTPPTPPSSRRW